MVAGEVEIMHDRVAQVFSRTASAGAAAVLALALVGAGCGGDDAGAAGTAPEAERLDPVVRAHVDDMLTAGRDAFRYDTFGDQVFWGDSLKLHHAVAGEANGGVGDGVSPRTALQLGLKVDVDVLPPNLRNSIARGDVDLDSPATTLTLLELDSVVGVTGFFDAN